MKNRLFKCLLIGMITLSFLTSTLMVTQDELSDLYKEINQLLSTGVTKEEIIEYVGDAETVDATKMLKEAQENGYFDKNKSETPAETSKPTPTPEPHKHKYSNKLTVEPTCTEAGTLTYTCECGDTYEETVPKLEHKYVSEVTKASTCTEAGETTYKCTLCGDSYTEPIETTGHKDGQFKVTKEATCTEDGEKEIYCSACHELIRTETIPATGHVNTVNVEHNAATIFEEIALFVIPNKEEVVCMKCMEVLETHTLPVPVWHYIVVFVVGGVLIICAAITIMHTLKGKRRKKSNI